MRVSTLCLSALAGFAVAAPAPYYPFPLSDNFPSPSAAQLKSIQITAGGSLPGGPLATKLTPAAIATVQLIALNELFEVAYFTKLLENLKSSAPGYTVHPDKYSRNYVIAAFNSIQKQEELHALGANAILSTAGAQTIAPCKYLIPDLDFESAVALANTFTDVVLGVLPQAQTQFAADGGQELGYVNLVGSIIAQEAEQNGWYRSLAKKIPSAAPFLTTEPASFAFTFLTSVIAPGCPGVDLVKKSIPTYPPITVVKGVANHDSKVTYTVKGKLPSKSSLVYLSGQNLPAAVAITDVSYKGGVTTFCAEFPFSTDGFARGLTIAAVVKSAVKTYASAAEVAAITAYGPGIIEVS